MRGPSGDYIKRTGLGYNSEAASNLCIRRNVRTATDLISEGNVKILQKHYLDYKPSVMALGPT